MNLAVNERRVLSSLILQELNASVGDTLLADDMAMAKEVENIDGEKDSTEEGRFSVKHANEIYQFLTHPGQAQT